MLVIDALLIIAVVVIAAICSVVDGAVFSSCFRDVMQCSCICSCIFGSIAPSGLAIEVGPLAHGTMNASLLEDTRRYCTVVLTFVMYSGNTPHEQCVVGF